MQGAFFEGFVVGDNYAGFWVVSQHDDMASTLPVCMKSGPFKSAYALLA